ncbi:MAG: T9SS type A sorting domain-containing protein [Candidatus Marinimicrobia bacterium]|nr:T9SS type A sorting domain-containing protein [Candidatus Neomarinimicrobiota bacterium]MCF7841179.1 T9SS type A sorting domain-containing protein [Candidatus Neomarinimicrobiota bacterium]MCF7902444.1 T9SS type A sorting domain-containing protein [Candidatus Neomarinimicrobiota bacterium]
MNRIKLYRLLALMILVSYSGYSQQITIPRVTDMPNMPQPYLMRDWKAVAQQYDSLVFDLNATGQYLPLVWINTNTINYPDHTSFGLHTVVGTPYPSSAEAINVIPAVVGASLVGIDKSDQFGVNWVLGCEEFFNRRPAENVYLNSPVTSSGDDWWYAVMPNVFFYQLNALYPHTGDFDFQFNSVAYRWCTAVETMGGSAAPWNRASMNYRGWYLASMTPYTQGVTEPEAAGAIAWLLYHAYTITGNVRYRMGAEWAMEFLDDFPNNAAYELQLPYGSYIAARMNAELGTTYDLEKFVNWSFDPVGNVRQWGVTLGNWGGYDCDGLVGEALNDGYAFLMNGYEMAAALIPMIRYDDRFAHALGKWILNMANASRLFYANYLPADHQDGEAWSYIYDPQAVIGHEAMREFALGTGISPFATGDAISGGWGATNFALYGSSHIGMMASLVDTTNISGILKLDLLATDFYRQDAYPSYLFYNPYDIPQLVQVDVGNDPVDVYDAVSNAVILTGVSGTVNLPVGSDEAVVAVLLPVGAPHQFELDKLVVNGIVADYRTGQPVANYPPRIKALATVDSVFVYGQAGNIYCTATDRNDQSLTYYWQLNSDTLDFNGAVYSFSAPDSVGDFTFRCTVCDSSDACVSDSLVVPVVEAINHPPVIEDLTVSHLGIALGDTVSLACQASDPDNDSLTYTWSCAGGEFLNDTDSLATWIAPNTPGYYRIFSQVSDSRGGFARDSLGLVVQDSSSTQVGVPVAFYPFNGNANDESGLENNGIVTGADLTIDRHGNPAAAYTFNGSSDNIRVPSNGSLNFTDAISVSIWMKPHQLYTDRESYPISHGNWENRWKVSIIPTKAVRWTVKTSDNIRDLDSQEILAVDNWYHVVGTYDGTHFLLYMNGQLDAQTTHSGQILTTNIDLMIGQVLPNNTSYNFNGVIDDIRIYDYAISPEDVSQLYLLDVGVHPFEGESLPTAYQLNPNYPNPFNSSTTISYVLPQSGTVKLKVYDLSGRLVKTIFEGNQSAGFHQIAWHSTVSSGLYFYRLESGNYTEIRKCIKLK